MSSAIFQSSMTRMQSYLSRSGHLFPSILVLSMAAIFFHGCASFNIDLQGLGPPVCLNDPVPLEVLEIRHFNHSMKAHYGLFGLVTWKEPDIRGYLENELERYHGEGIINLKIKGGFSPIDVLFGLPLSPLWFSRTYEVEGDIVRIGGPCNNARPLGGN